MVVNTNELFEFPKMFFVYIFGLFIVFFFLSDLVFHPVKLKKPSPAVCALFLVTLVSTVFSSNFYTSFFGYYSRFNDGFLSYLIFFGLYFVAINKVEKSDFEKLFKVVLFTIVPISLYGLAQYFGGPKFLWGGNSVDRVFSTFGQPNWLAQYLAMLLPVCLYFSLTDTQDNFKRWFSIYVLGFYCLWVTYSVSGILGFFVGLIFLVMVLVKNKMGNGIFFKDLKMRVVLMFAISIFIVISNMGTFGKKLNDVFIDLKKQTSVVKRVYAEESEYKLSDPGFIRFELWKSSFDLIKSSAKVFFIGSGPETFPYAFQPFRNERLNYSSEWDFVFNKPHNYYLEIWSESGIFALAIYLVIIYQALKKSPSFIIPAVVSFAVTNIFGWPNVSTSLLFWIFLSSIECSGQRLELWKK